MNLPSKGNAPIILVILVAGLLASIQAGDLGNDRESTTSAGTRTHTADVQVGKTPSRSEGQGLLTKVEVAEEPTAGDVPDYDRDAFGAAWKDVDRNGCDTRNDVLNEQLTNVKHRDGTNECVVVAGTLKDPYTGKEVSFSKSEAQAVQVDHVYSLSSAWRMGAHAWSQKRREAFANDQEANLQAVDGPANSSKSDKGPAEWSPANKGYACTYAVKYLRVAVKYRLPVTDDEHESISTTVEGACE